ncbi:MAG: hypothetical protein JSS66_09175 [Armatimonadetes bacterium]|nr:hypothetical protein [Armatimonadota bacterium]
MIVPILLAATLRPVFYDDFLGQTILLKVEELYPRDFRVSTGSSSTSDLTSQHVLCFTVRLLRPEAGSRSSYSGTTTVMFTRCGAPASTGATYGWNSTDGVATVSYSVSDTYGSAYRDVKLYQALPTSYTSGNPSNIKVQCDFHETWTDPVSGVQHTDLTRKPEISNEHGGANDASIDSRRGFGRANNDGGTDPESNWSSRNLNFGSYMWHGGLFVGNMPPYPSFNSDTWDRSGVARIQFWPTYSSSPAILFATLTLLDMGSPVIETSSTAHGNAPIPDLAAYVADPSDPNIGRTESDATWDKRWLLTDAERGTGNKLDELPDPPTTADGYDDSDPDDGGSYLNWPITSTDSAHNPGGIQYYTPDYSHGLILALNDEESQATTRCWRYFMSKEYQGQSGTRPFPYSDGAPRVWVTRIVNTWS